MKLKKRKKECGKKKSKLMKKNSEMKELLQIRISKFQKSGTDQTIFEKKQKFKSKNKLKKNS